jgi:drug/metabolite transporter (DMT)-like permease
MLAGAASSLIGGGAVAVTRALAGSVDPLGLGILRFGTGALLLLGIAGALGRLRVARRDAAALAGLGALLFAVFPLLFNASLEYTSATRAALALATMPMLTLAVAALAGVERPAPRKVAGIAVAIGGVAIGLGAGPADGAAPGGAAWLGDGLMLLAALCGAVYNVASRPFLGRCPALVAVAVAMAGGAAALVALAVPALALGAPVLAGWRGWGAGEVAGFAFLGVAGGAACFYLWAWALENTTPSRFAVTVTLNPLAATALAALLIGETVTLPMLLGLAAILCGIWVVNAGGDGGGKPAGDDGGGKPAAAAPP